MRRLALVWIAALLLCSPVSSVVLAEDEAGFVPLFDGKSLEKWDGNPEFWRVENGTLVGQTTAEKPTKGNTFLVWRGGELKDFVLKAEYKIEGGNSGIQYRSFEVPNEKWVVGGYQADIDAGGTFVGSCYGERFRGMLCVRGQKTVIGEDAKPKVVGEVGDNKELFGKVKADDWNEYTIEGKDFHFVQKINGTVMADLTDDDVKHRKASGVLALQLHAGPPMKISFRNIRLKDLSAK
jgi:hypothetical protein